MHRFDGRLESRITQVEGRQGDAKYPHGTGFAPFVVVPDSSYVVIAPCLLLLLLPPPLQPVSGCSAKCCRCPVATGAWAMPCAGCSGTPTSRPTAPLDPRRKACSSGGSTNSKPAATEQLGETLWGSFARTGLRKPPSAIKRHAARLNATRQQREHTFNGPPSTGTPYRLSPDG